MVVIRAGSAADAAQIAEVQRDSWFGAYAGIIADEIIDRVTALDGGARVRQSFRTRPWQRMIVAVPDGEDAAGIVGYAAFGPETDVLGAPWPHPLSTDGEERRVAELYALYVRPAWWSTGTGRALMDRVLARSVAARLLVHHVVGAAGQPARPPFLRAGRVRAGRRQQRAHRPRQCPRVALPPAAITSASGN